MALDENDDMRIENNYSLKAHNTFGIDAKCRQFIEYATETEAQEVAELLREERKPFIIIGGGSNLLLTKDYEGIVVHATVKGVERHGQRLTCGAGEEWDTIVARSLEMGLYGAENLSLIPGDVGASAVQNIGAYGAEAKDLIRRVHAVEIASGKVCEIDHSACEYGYRQSRFKHDWKNQYLIVSVEYEFSETFEPRLDYGNIRAELEHRGISEPTPQQLRQTIIDIRLAKLPDPKVMGNAGSFFMNPIVSRAKYESLAAQYDKLPYYELDADHVKIPAGWMIDQCGWKGKSLGRAGVHDKQALVLVNLGGATGEEIVTLCETIQKDVKAQFDIDIYPEVNII